MKNIIFLFAILSSTACHTEKNLQIPEFEVQNAALEKLENEKASLGNNYENLPAHVQFQIPDRPNEFDPESQKAYLKSSGLPLEDGFYDWSTTHTLSESLKIYREFSQQKHRWISVFKQYYGWLLLTRYRMLSGGVSNLNEVEYVVNQLIDAKYGGYELLHQSIAYLKQNGSSIDLNKIKMQIAAYHATNEAQRKERKQKMETAGIRFNQPKEGSALQQRIAGYEKAIKMNEEAFQKIMRIEE